MNYCPKCGFEVKDMKYCPKCGFEVSSTPVTILEDTRENVPNTDDAEAVVLSGTHNDAENIVYDIRAALVGKKPEHYIPIFDQMEQYGGTRWNWCGFLFSPYWLAYRKLYGWSAIAMFSPAVIGFIIGIALSQAQVSDSGYNAIGRMIGIVISIIFGLVSNSLYKKRIDRLAAEAPSNPIDCENYIKQKGGTSIVALILAIILYIALYLSLALI